jgi:hypothetical protein
MAKIQCGEQADMLSTALLCFIAFWIPTFVIWLIQTVAPIQLNIRPVIFICGPADGQIYTANKKISSLL